MIVKIKKVYYCQFCKKHGLRRDAIEKHEEHCTKNIHRTCRLCQDDEDTPDFALPEIVAKYQHRFLMGVDDIGLPKVTWPNGGVKLKDIEADVGYCPCCTLAVLRICNLSDKLEFDYKKALAGWWQDRRENEKDG